MVVSVTGRVVCVVEVTEEVVAFVVVGFVVVTFVVVTGLVVVGLVVVGLVVAGFVVVVVGFVVVTVVLSVVVTVVFSVVVTVVCGFSEDKGFKEKDFNNHIQNVLKTDGYKNISVKVFTDINKYTERLEQLKYLEIDEGVNILGIMDTFRSVVL